MFESAAIRELVAVVDEYLDDASRAEIALLDRVGEEYSALVVLSHVRVQHALQVSDRVLDEVRELMEDSEAQRAELERFYPELVTQTA